MGPLEFKMAQTYQSLGKEIVKSPKSRKPLKSMGWIFLAIGIIILLASTFSSSTILAFIGLSLVFWGPLLLYIAPEKQVSKKIFESTLMPYIKDLTQILKELKYLGKPVYLPPKYLKDFDECKIFLPQHKITTLPSPEIIQAHTENIFLEEPKALLLFPPGYFLTELFEKKLGTSFTKINFKYLQLNLPKLLVQDLEIADEFELKKIHSVMNQSESKFAKSENDEYEIFQMKISNSIFQNDIKWLEESSILNKTIGSPLCSAIACSIAKATGNAIIIKKINISSNEKTIVAVFESLEPLKKKMEKHLFSPAAIPKIESYNKPILSGFRTTRPLSKFGIFLLILGLFLVAWISWLTLTDLLIWGKDLVSILFSSRQEEIISLGIGMKVIHYLLLALGFLFSGLVLSFKKNRRDNLAIAPNLS